MSLYKVSSFARSPLLWRSIGGAQQSRLLDYALSNTIVSAAGCGYPAGATIKGRPDRSQRNFKTMAKESCAGVSLPAKPPARILDDNVTVPELFSLKGKVASVSGGSAGIGWAIVEAFAQAGADIAVWYNSTDPKAKSEALAKKYGVKINCYKIKITDVKAVDEGIQQQVKDFGKIDIFVANAGIINEGTVLDTPTADEDWHRVIDVDLTTIYYCAKAVGKVFKKQGNGSFIITTSISGHVANLPNHHAAYNTAKAGAIHLGKSLALEWASFARVNCVSPGYIATNMIDGADTGLRSKFDEYTPLGRPGLAKELAGAYLYFASDASTYTTGSDLLVDGGYTSW